MKKKSLILSIIFIAIITITTNVFAADTCPGTNLEYLGCGAGKNMVTGIPAIIPRLTSFAVTIMRVIIPIVVIITATIEMFKSIISGNPDNIAKCRKRVINKYIGALLAFFIISFTTNIVKLIARGNDKAVAAKCFDCYLNNHCITPSQNPAVCKGVGGVEDSSSSSDKDTNPARAKLCSEYSLDECPSNCDKSEGRCVSKGSAVGNSIQSGADAGVAAIGS